MTFSEAAMIMMSGSSGSSEKDPRIAVLERATEFGRFRLSCNDNWELRVKRCPELDNYMIQFGYGYFTFFCYYGSLVMWGC